MSALSTIAGTTKFLSRTRLNRKETCTDEEPHWTQRATMLRRTASYIKSHHLALFALFFALGGTSSAASTALLPRNSVGTKQVINGSLQTDDLNKTARTALKGNRGLRGPAGAQGAQGATGATGATGAQGCTGSAGSVGDQALCCTGCRRHAHEEQRRDIGG